MTPSNATALLHVLGFLTASALYVLLAAMTIGTRSRSHAAGRSAAGRSDLIPLGTALLGLAWNVGELVMYGLHATASPPPPWLVVSAFAALSYLPAVVVHSAVVGGPSLRPPGRHPMATRAIIAAAYGLSTVATAINLVAALRRDPVPSSTSLLVLSVGFVALVGAMVAYSRRQPAWRRALPAGAVAAFAVMLTHLTHHSATSDRWTAELVGHHGSLLVVLVILYQDYRFALADLFLKRVVTLLAVTAVAAGLYAGIVVPVLLPRLGAGAGGRSGDPLAEAALLALWVGCALAYPALRRQVTRFVDRTLLRRPDTRELLATLSARTAALQTAEQVLDTACEAVAPALSATRVYWTVAPSPSGPPDAAAPERGALGAGTHAANGAGGAGPRVSVGSGSRETTVDVPTVDSPAYVLVVGALTGGRRLLSDDQALLADVARVVARRIDALRVAHERFERDMREQQIMQLATEAELRALRAQLNPHFLFNALTTIGYLVREAPDRALDTLFRLTDVLRAVLKRSDGEFTTLGDEMEIVSAYLAIERARFEDRLNVTVDVPPALTMVHIPPLVLQPVVENAVKHGIAPLARGGRIIISARAETTATTASSNGTRVDRRDRLWLSVTDTGMGAPPAELASRRRAGIGLTNIERRLERYYGDAASLEIRTAVGVGTTVDIRFPVGAGDAVGLPR